MDDLISKLSEIRSEYNCFDEDEEPYYRALSESIRILSQRADGDTISRKAAIEALRKCQTYLFDERDPDKKIELRSAELVIEDLPSAQPKEPNWVKRVKEHLTEAESRPYIRNPLAWALYQTWKEIDAWMI